MPPNADKMMSRFSTELKIVIGLYKHRCAVARHMMSHV